MHSLESNSSARPAVCVGGLLQWPTVNAVCSFDAVPLKSLTQYEARPQVQGFALDS